MRTQRQSAFTLMELLLAISIIVLVAGAVGSLVTALSGGSLVAETLNEVKGYLLMARQQAVQYHRPVAVFFLPPTDLTPNSRMMLFELKPTLPNPSNIEDVSNWYVMPGGYGANLRAGIEVRNRAGAGLFCIPYSANGSVDSRCPANNTSIQIGSQTGRESAMRAKAVAINRVTGAVLQLRRGE